MLNVTSESRVPAPATASIAARLTVSLRANVIIMAVWKSQSPTVAGEIIKY